MDVHVNRTPVSGRVLRVNFKRGRFLPAYHRDAAMANEHSEIWIEHNGQTIVFRQLVDRKSTRLNSSHEWISYAVFCLQKKTTAPADLRAERQQHQIDRVDERP